MGISQQRAAYRDKTSHALFATGRYEWFSHSFSRYPQEGFAVANYFAATELAPAVARAFNKLKTLRQDASSWLLKYLEHAITGLLPAALGKASEAQDNARAALRMLTENGHQPLLQEIALAL